MYEIRRYTRAFHTNCMILTPVSTASDPAFPDETNTGTTGTLVEVPAEATSGTGWTWSAGDDAVLITGAAATFSGFNVAGVIVVETSATGAVVSNSCAITKTFVGIYVLADDVIVEDCEVYRDPTNTGETIHAIRVEGDDCIVRRCNLHDTADGVFISGVVNITVEDNYIHSLFTLGADPHYDGIQLEPPCSGVLIQGSNIINPNPQTSAVTVGNNGGAIEITVDGCRLIGGGWTINIDDDYVGNPPVVAHIIDCRIGDGSLGYVTYDVDPPATWTGNVDDNTGDPIPPP